MKKQRVLYFILELTLFVNSTCCASAYVNADSDEVDYFAVFVEGKKVGHAVQKRVVSNGQVTSSEEIKITINRMGTPLNIEIKETCIETMAGEPLRFSIMQKTGTVVKRMFGRVDRQKKVSVTTSSMGSAHKIKFQWPEEAVMTEGLRLLTLKKSLDEGTLYYAKIFTPEILQGVHAQIHIGPKQNIDLLGRVVNVTEITTTLNMPKTGEIVCTGFVDKDLRILKSIIPIAEIQVEMITCAKEFALGRNDTVELIEKMFLPSPEPLGNLNSIKSITYHLVRTIDTPLIVPSSDNQKVQQFKDGKMIVTVEPLVAPTGAEFPYKGQDKIILEATKPTRFLQSDHEQVIALARRAVGDTTDPAVAVRKIEAFVAGYIENRNLSVGYASAAEVAASRQGDCSEFAVLTAAMCRAVGIPAQVVFGVAYVRDFAGHQGFGGHVWTQAYIDGKWIGLDAAFKGVGRGGYDAGHIALIIGDGEPECFFNLESILSQFKIEKFIVRKK